MRIMIAVSAFITDGRTPWLAAAMAVLVMIVGIGLIVARRRRRTDDAP